jgi:23S rRNA (adenine2030-N6)-methyltransferase
MKYRHRYHAGNFADCFKHVVLLELLRQLQRKRAPMFYLETHAGQGGYDFDPTAPAGAEHQQGIGRLLRTHELPEPVRAYVELVIRLGGDAERPGVLRTYPGSPLLALAVLRDGDRAVFYEILASAARELTRRIGRRRNVSVLRADGYAGLTAQLPPKERRGLVLIDPPYENPQQEFEHAVIALQAAHQRWPTGIYAIWYPIKRRATIQTFHSRLKATGIRRILCAELSIYPDDSRVSLNGCGTVIVNPPYRLEFALNEALPGLHAALGGKPGTRANCFWLVPE